MALAQPKGQWWKKTQATKTLDSRAFGAKVNPRWERFLRPEQVQLGTVVSFAQRDPDGITFGDPRFWGNCSPLWALNVFEQVEQGPWQRISRKIERVADWMEGSGTIRDLCRAIGMPYFGYDLATGTDVVNDDVEGDADVIFLHLPYWKMVEYWKVHGRTYDPRDLSAMSLPDFLKAIEAIEYKALNALTPGGFLVVLLGDYVKNGFFYHLTQWMPIVGQVYRECIKMQHNTRSMKQSYTGGLVYILHERYLLIHKPDPFKIPILKANLPEDVDIREDERTTWFQLVHAALQKRGGRATWKELNEDLAGCRKARNNRHVPEKIRQTVYRSQFLESEGETVRIRKTA